MAFLRSRLIAAVEPRGCRARRHRIDPRRDVETKNARSKLADGPEDRWKLNEALAAGDGP
jgi:hypothetical protein